MNIFYIKSNATKGTCNLYHKTYNFSSNNIFLYIKTGKYLNYFP